MARLDFRFGFEFFHLSHRRDRFRLRLRADPVAFAVMALGEVPEDAPRQPVRLTLWGAFFHEVVANVLKISRVLFAFHAPDTGPAWFADRLMHQGACLGVGHPAPGSFRGWLRVGGVRELACFPLADAVGFPERTRLLDAARRSGRRPG